MKSQPYSSSRLVKHCVVALIVLAVMVLVSPGIGSRPIGLLEAWRSAANADDNTHYIAFGLRLPRTVRAITAGLTLALTGAVYQTLFRNVLATPYTLGIASGGSLGALVAIKFAPTLTLLGLSNVECGAFTGCAAVVGLVFLLASSGYRVTGNTLVLGGVTIGLFCSAMMMFVTYFADLRDTFQIVRWMMGDLESVGHTSVLRLIAPLAISWVVLCFCAPALNQYEMGDELAASRGVLPVRLQLVSVAFASLATACVVALWGPIGFVGLIVPQMMRRLVGRDHRLLLPISALWGGAFLVVCDWLTRLLPAWWGRLTGAEITAAPLPIGVMTAVIGAPVFIVMLPRRRMD